MMSMLSMYSFCAIWKETRNHPHIGIKNGNVILTFWNYKFRIFTIPFKKTISVPLTSVKLKPLPLSNDIYLSNISRGNKKQYSLLDFSECVDETFLGIHSSKVRSDGLSLINLTDLEEKRWCESPYLCFSASPFENEMLEAFFNLLACG